MESLDQRYRRLLEAVSFAARAHHGQIRKDGKTPTAAHVFRVCLILRHVFGLDDLLDSRHLSAERRRRSVRRSLQYLEALQQPDLPDPVRPAAQLVARLLAEIESTLT